MSGHPAYNRGRRIAVRVMVAFVVYDVLTAAACLFTGYPQYAAIGATSAVICALCARAVSGMSIR